jgi:hypothetical protein
LLDRLAVYGEFGSLQLGDHIVAPFAVAKQEKELMNEEAVV